MKTDPASRLFALGALALAALLGACATPADGTAVAACNPASPHAEAAPLAQLGAALREDPPLPGEVRAGWPRLDDPRPAAEAAGAGSRGEHAHHH